MPGLSSVSLAVVSMPDDNVSITTKGTHNDNRKGTAKGEKWDEESDETDERQKRVSKKYHTGGGVLTRWCSALPTPDGNGACSPKNQSKSQR